MTAASDAAPEAFDDARAGGGGLRYSWAPSGSCAANSLQTCAQPCSVNENRREYLLAVKVINDYGDEVMKVFEV
ncbi:MAG: hypothetical protein ACR2KG_03365 [Nocardioidaceae bacterium]